MNSFKMRSLARRPNVSAGREALALFIGLSNASSRRLRLCTQCRYNATGSSLRFDSNSLLMSRRQHAQGVNQHRWEILPNRQLAQPFSLHSSLHLPTSTHSTRPPHLHNPRDHRIPFPKPNLQIPQHIFPRRVHPPKF